jgi:hypothetical protein
LLILRMFDTFQLLQLSINIIKFINDTDIIIIDIMNIIIIIIMDIIIFDMIDINFIDIIALISYE